MPLRLHYKQESYIIKIEILIIILFFLEYEENNFKYFLLQN